MKKSKSNSSAGARRQANVRSGAYDGRYAPKRVECPKTEGKREACRGSEWLEEWAE